MTHVNIQKIEGYHVYLNEVNDKKECAITKYTPLIGFFANVFGISIKVHDQKNNTLFLNKTEYRDYIYKQHSSCEHKLESLYTHALKTVKGELDNINKRLTELRGIERRDPDEVINKLAECIQDVENTEKNLSTKKKTLAAKLKK